jgi:hypothetical protein
MAAAIDVRNHQDEKEKIIYIRLLCNKLLKQY